ncbi:MAG TPA: response regulator [Casimicrobiaceae bacterium]|nr:response regulator [Casimicrobiaceae bacterium]
MSAPTAIDPIGRHRVTNPGKHVVAVVDDDPRILQSLETLLESADYSVRLYSSAANLLENTDALAELDCLISDIGMSVVDGFELLRATKAAQPDLPVILITGRPEAAKLASVDSRGAVGVFQKPFDGAQLLEAIDKALQASPRRK